MGRVDSYPRRDDGPNARDRRRGRNGLRSTLDRLHHHSVYRWAAGGPHNAQPDLPGDRLPGLRRRRMDDVAAGDCPGTYYLDVGLVALLCAYTRHYQLDRISAPER